MANLRLVQSPNPKRTVLPITGRASVSQGTAIAVNVAVCVESTKVPLVPSNIDAPFGSELTPADAKPRSALAVPKIASTNVILPLVTTKA